MSRRNRAAQSRAEQQRQQREESQQPGRERDQALEQAAQELDDDIEERDIEREDLEMRQGQPELRSEPRRDITATQLDERFDQTDVDQENLELDGTEPSQQFLQQLVADEVNPDFENVDVEQDDVTLDDEGRITDDTILDLAARDTDAQLDRVDVEQDDIRLEDGTPQPRERVFEQQLAGELDEQFEETDVQREMLELDGQEPTEDFLAQLLAAEIDSDVDQRDIEAGDVDLEEGGLRQSVRDEIVASQMDGVDADEIETEPDGSLTRDTQRELYASAWDDLGGARYDVEADDVGFIGGAPVLSDWELEQAIRERRAAIDISRETGRGVDPDALDLSGDTIQLGEGAIPSLETEDLANDGQFAGVETTLGADEPDAGAQVEFTDALVADVIASDLDQQFQETDITAEQIARGDEIGATTAQQREWAAADLAAQIDQEVPSDEVVLDDGEFLLDEEFERELAAEELGVDSSLVVFDGDADEWIIDEDAQEFLNEGLDSPFGELQGTVGRMQSFQQGVAEQEQAERIQGFSERADQFQSQLLAEQFDSDLDILEDTVDPETGTFTPDEVPETDDDGMTRPRDIARSGFSAATDEITDITEGFAETGARVSDELLDPVSGAVGTGLEVSQTFRQPTIGRFARTEQPELPSTTEEALEPTTRSGELFGRFAGGGPLMATTGGLSIPQAGVDTADFATDAIDVATGPGDETQRQLAQSQLEDEIDEPLPDDFVVETEDGFTVDEQFAEVAGVDPDVTVDPDQSGLADAAQMTGGAARGVAGDFASFTRENPALTAGSLVASTGALGAASSVGRRTGLAAETAIQPDALAATAAVRRAPGGERVFQALPGSRIAPEEFALGTLGAAGGRAASGARSLRSGDAFQFDASPRQQAQFEALTDTAGFEFQGRDPTAVESAGRQLDVLFDPDVTTDVTTASPSARTEYGEFTGIDVESPQRTGPGRDTPPLYDDIFAEGGLRSYLGDDSISVRVVDEIETFGDALRDDRGQAQLVPQTRQRRPEPQRDEVMPEMFEDFQQRQQQELDMVRDLGSDLDAQQQPFRESAQTRTPRQQFEQRAPGIEQSGPGFSPRSTLATETEPASMLDPLQDTDPFSQQFVGTPPAQDVGLSPTEQQFSGVETSGQQAQQPRLGQEPGLALRQERAAIPDTRTPRQEFALETPSRTFDPVTRPDPRRPRTGRPRPPGRGRTRPADDDDEVFELFAEETPDFEETTTGWVNPIAELGDPASSGANFQFGDDNQFEFDDGGELPWQ